MKKRKKDLNSNLLETFGFLIYLSIGFVFIFLIIFSNIKVLEMSDPYYSCGMNAEKQLSSQMGNDTGISLKIKRADLSDSRLTLERYGMEVVSVNMNGKSPVMIVKVRPESNDRLGYRLCQLKDTLAVTDFSVVK